MTGTSARVSVFAVAIVLFLCLASAARAETSDAEKPVVRTLQTPFPTQTTTTPSRSITFLASGYQDDAVFWGDVQKCISALHNNSGGLITDPWTRYVNLFSIYGVYERSAGLGATRLQGPLHECRGMKQCEGDVVENNLDCKLSTPNPHYLSCSINAVTALVALSPQQDIVVVLVNINEPSAMATDGVAYITNDENYMIYFLLHFLNRAVAGLQEEYSFGFAETLNPEKYAKANCAVSEASAEAKWGYWNSVEATTAPALANESGCTFSNFVPPAQHQCVMRNSSSNQMCPVCQEALTRAFFQKGVNQSALPTASQVPLNLLAGLCPPADRVLYVNPDTDAVIVAHAGDFAVNSYVTVRWFLNNAPIGDGASLVYSNVSSMTFPSTITVTLTDRSPYLQPLDDGSEATFQQNASFTVSRRDDNVACDEPALSCLSGLAATAASTSTCTVYTPNRVFGELAKQHYSLSTVDTAARAAETPSSDDKVEDPPYNKRDVIVAACVSGGVGLVVIVTVTLVYFCCSRKNPREVLNIRTLDRFFYVGLCFGCVLVLALSVLIIVFAVVYIPVHFVFGKQIFICGIVIGGVMFVFAVLNYCGALFRWFIFCVVCCVLFLLGGIGLFATGTYSIWAYMNRFSDSLAETVGKLWVKTAATTKGGEYLCEIQQSMKCSGYHVSCALTDSSECVPGCASNTFAIECEERFLHFVGGHYYPVGILCVVSGFILVLTAALDMFYFLSFRQLSRTGKLRRSFRNDPRAPVIPVTYNEADAIHKMFNRVCSKDQTLEGVSAVRFLEAVFGEALSKEYVEVIRKSGPLTYDEIMSMHFPFVMSSSIDPRMLTPDSVEACRDMIELEKKQYHKQKRFIAASGTLSPESLYILFQTYGKQRFLPNEDDILKAIEREAAKPSGSEPLLRGLSPREVEGLRGAWVTLHPTIVGNLTDSEIDLFYQWSHGEVLKDSRAFDAWKRKLDIRQTGQIGWVEFCYPYAQSSLLQKARSFLSDLGKEVPPEMLSRSFVEEKYGHEIVERAFLSPEEEIPVERLLTLFLGERDDADSSDEPSKEESGEKAK